MFFVLSVFQELMGLIGNTHGGAPVQIAPQHCGHVLTIVVIPGLETYFFIFANGDCVLLTSLWTRI